MREPAFWWQPPSWMSRVLAPIALIYGTISGRRMLQRGHRATVPVICVGNYTLGGAGKTPTVIALLKLLRAAGETPVVLSRGYGGQLAGPMRVDLKKHVAADVGDEPLLLAQVAPVIVSADRVAGADAARSASASVIVMDDGFQNPSLQKDVSLIVIDAGRAIGNTHVFPAGPLRAPLAAQLTRTDVLLVSGEGAAAVDVAHRVRGKGGVVLEARIVPAPAAVAALHDRPLLAFAGIGDPLRFFATLRACGLDVVETRAFDDHHPFTADEVRALIATARENSLTLVTTEKDFVRLRDIAGVDASAIRTLPITLEFDDQAALRDFLVTRLAQSREQIGVERKSG
jgi:tetraacyldisaccharide 4'-kinase